MPTRLALPTALLVLALAPAGASARTVTSENIVSPHGQISCLSVVDSTEIECSASFVEEIGDLDTYLALRARGRSRLSERGDYPGSGAPRQRLRFGDTWKRPGIRCTMRASGLTCRNRDDHGFHLEKGHVRRF